MAKMYPEAIATFERFNTPEIAAVASRSDIISANEFIYQSYIDQNDTVNAVASLQQSIQRFPEEAWFIQNLINLYINSKQSDVAIEYLSKAIEKEPQKGEYYMIRGNLLLNENKLDEALADLEKSISIDEKLVEGQAGIGRVYYNKAVMKGDEANRQSDQKAYEAAKKEEADLYFQSVPYFEKAHQLAPDDRNISLLLKGLYWRFRDKDGYLDKYNKLNEELNK
jgi:tetratricopeptide (TPR) repeat protein